MPDDLTHLIALTIDRSDGIISEKSRGKRPYSQVVFLNGELLHFNEGQQHPTGIFAEP